jgi:alkane 1-monooxygenase
MFKGLQAFKYTAVFTTPAIVLYALYTGGYSSFSALFFLFGVIPILELLTQGSSKNLSPTEEEDAKNNRTYDILLFSLVPIQYGLLVFFLFALQRDELSTMEAIGLITAFGMSCGILGINAAHELGHRRGKLEQTMSKMLLLTSQYMHFFIEHNRGHHRYVSTDEDPASARYGETVYRFWWRSITMSWLSAWKLEFKRLRTKQVSPWHVQNEMLRFQIIQLLFLVVILVVFNAFTLICYLFAAGIGILMLETVNYIEHYGLRRKKQNGRYERTQPVHSWNSNHPIGRLLLLELSRHSDHHFMASRPYPLLRHFDDSPQMPTGYPGMMLLSLIPPLWFHVMHKRISFYKTTQSGMALDT